MRTIIKQETSPDFTVYDLAYTLALFLPHLTGPNCSLYNIHFESISATSAKNSTHVISIFHYFSSCFDHSTIVLSHRPNVKQLPNKCLAHFLKLIFCDTINDLLINQIWLCLSDTICMPRTITTRQTVHQRANSWYLFMIMFVRHNLHAMNYNYSTNSTSKSKQLILV